MEEYKRIIDQVFTDDEDIVNALEETNIIDEPSEDPSIPTEDEDTGGGGDSSPVSVISGDTVDPDAEDIINSVEDNDLSEAAVAVDEEEVEPIISNQEVLPTIGTVEAGDRVMIALINGQATVLGTVGSGDKQQDQINTISADVAVLGTVVAGKASVTDLNAQSARIDDLETDNTNIKGRLNAAEGNITSLTANKASVSDLTASNARITTLENTALTAESAVITNLQANKVDISDLQADYITANQIAANYAKLDTTNINTATIRDAWIDKIMVQSGLLSHSGTIYELDAIQLNADRITAGTIDVQRLIVTVNNHKYLVQFDAQGSPTYVKLDGDAIQDLSITADKIVAGAITAEKITTSNIVGTGGWINLRSGTFSYTNSTSGQGLSWDGSSLTVNGSVTVTGGNVYTKTETDSAVNGAAATATNYITEINQAGIKIHAEDYDASIASKNNYLVVDSDGIQVYKAGNSVAQFGADGGRVGQSTKAHSIIDSSGQRFYGFDGTTQLANIGYGEGYSASGTAVAPYYSFGYRLEDLGVGNFSTAEGNGTRAVGFSSHAEGYYSRAIAESSHAEGNSTKATGIYSHSEGDQTEASAPRSHAEGLKTTASGYNSHAEGRETTASLDNAHAEGRDTTASGYNSHAQNKGTIAQGEEQTAIGSYNIANGDPYSHYLSDHLFIIGNGSNDSSRSNAFTVDWDGSVEAAGDIHATGSISADGGISITPTFLTQTKNYASTSERVSLSTGTTQKTVLSVTAPFTGYVFVTGYVQITANSSGNRSAHIVIGGNDVVQDVRGAHGTNTSSIQISACYPVTQGDTVAIRAWQTSGNTLYAGGQINALFFK